MVMRSYVRFRNSNMTGIPLETSPHSHSKAKGPVLRSRYIVGGRDPLHLGLFSSSQGTYRLLALSVLLNTTTTALRHIRLDHCPNHPNEPY